MSTIHVEFDIPAALALQAGMDADNASAEARRMLALFLYEHRYLSLGKACELGNINQWEFAEMNSRLGIPMAYGEDDLAADRARLADV